MSAAVPADLFGPTEAGPPPLACVPDRISVGLARLEAAPVPAWPLDQAARWPAAIDRVRAFAGQWDGAARACGWEDVSLYGLHRRAPYANLATMGAAFVIALGQHPPLVTAVTSESIAVIMPTSSRLRVYRCSPDPDAVPAWSLA